MVKRLVEPKGSVDRTSFKPIPLQRALGYPITTREMPSMPVRPTGGDDAAKPDSRADLRAGIAAWTIATACGTGREAQRTALGSRRSGLIRNDYPGSGLHTWIGRVGAVDTHRLPERFAALESRNNRLADLALGLDGFDDAVIEAIARFGAHRVGVLIGTSTASIGRTESAYAALADAHVTADFDQPAVHNPHSAAHFVAARLGIGGPCMTLSTACSSSGKVFASAARWLAAGAVDAVVVGGVDSLCLSILHGFASLELVSGRPCRPFDADRDGISIGEAAGFALLTRPADNTSGIELAGAGETSDAWHMAQPHPQGRGARDAMRAAIGASALQATDIGYVNLHGTATPANDAVEAMALAQVFDTPLAAASTKAFTGHTLGAAGIVGAITVIESLIDDLLPGTLNLDTPEPGLAFPILAENARLGTDHVMSNSFGFGGNNCSLVFSRVGEIRR